MPLLYPDVIKLDLRLLAERDPLDVARVVTAVGAEAERRHATVLAEGDRLRGAARDGARRRRDARPGLHARRAGPLPIRCPTPGRPLRLGGSGGDPSGPLPYQRVTNWKRPTRGPLELAERTAAMLSGQASALGPTGMLLAAPGRLHPSRATRRCATRSGSSACSSRARSRTRGPRSRSGPATAPASSRASQDDEWCFATSYDRELVVECALLLMARLPQSPPPR